MKPSKQEEILLYLVETLAAVRAIKNMALTRNKTTRIKAVLSMLQIVEARLDASAKYAKAGGHTEFAISMQKDLYNPIIEYLADEVGK